MLPTTNAERTSLCRENGMIAAGMNAFTSAVYWMKPGNRDRPGSPSHIPKRLATADFVRTGSDAALARLEKTSETKPRPEGRYKPG